MITSTANPKVRELVKLKRSAGERSRQGVFLVEGIKMVREIPPEMLVEQFAAGRDFSESVFQYISDTQSPQGQLAVVRQMNYVIDDLMGDAFRTRTPLIVILENLQDPGNLGTIVRTAEAAGATGILMSKGCADIYNPKVIRSTMGSIFRVPFCTTEDLPGAIRKLQKKGVRIHAAHLKGSESLYTQTLAGPCAFLIGNESRGLSDEIASLADSAVRIPMSGKVESLNAAMACSILLFETKRQRDS